MKKNNSLNQFKGVNISNISIPTTQKKVQGFDHTTKSSFTTKIQNLKQKPKTTSIQSQYISGLQDEIHYLQLQLKLLQQKDQAKHGQIDQLQKFFSDGVPINQNILAIKNGFNNYKSNGEKQIHQLSNQKKERQNLIQGLKTRISHMQKDLDKEQKGIRSYQNILVQQLHSLVRDEAKLKKQIELDDDQLKQLKTQNRKLSQKLTSLQRNKQIEMVMTLKNDNHKLDKLTKIKQSILQKQADYQQLQKQFQDLLKQEQQKSYVLKVQQQNLNLKKKAISMQRQLNALQTKAQQKEMQLDYKLKQRHKQISSKSQMKTRVDIQKAKISKENSMKVQDIQKVAKEKQISLLQKIVSDNKKLAKYTQYYSDLLAKVQDSIQEMVEKKPELKSQVSAYTSQVSRQLSTLSEQKSRLSTLYSQSIMSQSHLQHYKLVIPPLTQKTIKFTQLIKQYKLQKDKLSQDIKVKVKQLDLVLILKGLNLEEVQMSKSSNANIQDKLVGFIRNWENLNRAH